MYMINGTEGLRERKRRTTHETIQQAALELFARHGFAATTVAAIAEAADVAPRTVALHFPAKEDLLFPDGALYEALANRLEHRRGAESALDALRAWIGDILAEPASDDERRREWRNAQARRAIIDADPELRQRERGHLERTERLLAKAIARDLGAEPTDLAPQIAAAAAVAVFTTLERTRPLESDGPLSVEEGLAVVDRVLCFLRGGLTALSEAGIESHA
jgi:AcrR family transcriptional regulator